MRIISGTHKGRRITPPKNLPVRPTKDMAKEALFNILTNSYYFEELKVLDLFAGTGNMSFEFASRGCKEITSVDDHSGCISFIADKAKEWEFPIATRRMDVFKFLEKDHEKYDLIFADPPYDISAEEFDLIHKQIFESDMLLQDGILIIEHAKRTDLSHLDHFTTVRKYGNSRFSFFEAKK
ncbi:MAG: RsmD family RNA methyltransferase [Muriicola sp.]|nr:RsmD family RNA methyltransferase [Muriicola sp.]MBT8282314.1 RsmD family RNA methyltransferase [Muriicola sp.]NNK10582.1 methyltransferase [Flavobacteriaceae bacterium]